MIIYNSELYHYGVPRRSGRYKWGSGKNPYHHGADSAGRKAKANYKEAKRERKKAINEAQNAYQKYYNKSFFHPVATTKYALSLAGANTKPKTAYGKKTTKELDKRWTNYNDKLAKSIDSRAKYKQAKAEYKKTDQYKIDRRKKLAGLAAGTAAVAATAYLAKHPEKRAQMSNMIKDITQGKYRPRDLSGVAKAGRPNPNLKYGKAAYSKKKGVLPPQKALPVPSSSSVAGNKFRSVNRKYAGSAKRGPHPDISGQNRKIGIGFEKRVGVDAPFQGVIRRTSKTGKRLMPRTNSSNIRPTTRKLTSQTPYGAYTKRNPNHNKEPWQIFDYYKNNKKYREPGAASATGQKIYRNRQVNRLNNANSSSRHNYSGRVRRAYTRQSRASKDLDLKPNRLAANKDKFGNYTLHMPGSSLKRRYGARRYSGKARRLR